jgi:hypothetical protein
MDTVYTIITLPIFKAAGKIPVLKEQLISSASGIAMESTLD